MNLSDRAFFSLNTQSILWFRVGLGLYLIINLVFRLISLEAHYTDLGVLPRADLTPLLEPWGVSVHFFSGSIEFQWVLFLIHFVFAILLTLGIKPQWMAFFCWFFENSLQRRNPLVGDASDLLLSLVLLWTIFLPLDQNKRVLKKGEAVTSWGTAGYLIQLCLIYCFSVVLKVQSSFWLDFMHGGGIYYALHDDFATPLARSLENLPKEWLGFFSFMILIFELVAPLSFLLLKSQSRIKGIIVLGFFVFHASIGALLGIWKFAFLSILMWVPLIPGWIWSRNNCGQKAIVGAEPQFEKYLVMVLVVLISASNLFSIGLIPHEVISKFNPLLSLLSIHQNWSMFSSDLLKNPLVLEFKGKAKEGETRSLKLEGINENQTIRWHNYLDSIKYGGSNHANRLAEYVCRIEPTLQSVSITRLSKNQKIQESWGSAECRKSSQPVSSKADGEIHSKD